jgi:8-oxo-dGTP diphosphatase
MVLSLPTPKTDWFIYKYILDEQPFSIMATYNEKLQLLSMTEEVTGKDLLKAGL